MARLLDRLSLGVALGTTALTVVLYPRLPPRVPIHFDVHGVADGWAPRAIGAFLLPVVTLLTWALVRGGRHLVPRQDRERLDKSPTGAVGFVVVALLSALHLLALRAAMHPGGRLVGLVTLLSFAWIALGLVMPRVRRNPFVGVRTPWTLGSDENWARTHRFAGVTFITSAVLGLALEALVSTAPAVIVLVLGGLAPAIYSWRIAVDTRT